MKQALLIECFSVRCRANFELRTSCEPYLVGAAAVAFHAAHEGHEIRISYGDWSVESPGITDQMREHAAKRKEANK